MSFSCRLGTREDFPEILALQAENLLANTPAEKLSGGFVTTPFTVDQLEDLVRREGMFVIAAEGKLCGYVMSAGWDFFAQWPIFTHMVSLFPSFAFHGATMTEANSYQYGPVCIRRDMRGTDAFSTLFHFARRQMSARFPYGLTFINTKNERSYAAHRKIGGIEPIRQFDFNNNRYHFLGFLTTRAP